MSDLRFLCVPCDGIGPEIADATESVLNTLISELGLSIDLEHDLAGFDSLKKYGTTLREELLEKGRDRLRWCNFGTHVNHGLSVCR